MNDNITPAASPITTYFRVCDGVRVRFADTRADSDVTMLLLSPWPESLWAFRRVWDRLSAAGRVVAIGSVALDPVLAVLVLGGLAVLALIALSIALIVHMRGRRREREAQVTELAELKGRLQTFAEISVARQGDMARAVNERLDRMTHRVGTDLNDKNEIVNPARVEWEPGLSFVTPPGYWHSHYNDSDAPAHVIPLQDAGLHSYLRTLDIRFT